LPLEEIFVNYILFGFFKNKFYIDQITGIYSERSQFFKRPAGRLVADPRTLQQHRAVGWLGSGVAMEKPWAVRPGKAQRLVC